MSGSFDLGTLSLLFTHHFECSHDAFSSRFPFSSFLLYVSNEP